MNKYSSKAIKTAATVGMSLAMVLSAVPAVGNVTSVEAAISTGISARATATEAHKVLAAVLDELTDYADLYADDALLSAIEAVDINIAGKLNVNDELYYFVNVPANKKINDLGGLTVSSKKEADENVAEDAANRNGIEDGTTLEDIAKYLVANSYAMDTTDVDDEVIDFAKFIKGYGEGIAKLGTYFDNGNFKADTDDNIKIIKAVANGNINKNNIDDADAIYKTITDNEKYLNAMMNKANSTSIMETINNFKAEVVDYKDANEDIYNKAYIKQLEDTILFGEVSVYDAVEKDATIPYTQLSKVEKVLKDIKGDKNSALKAIAKYADVEDSEEVSNYIEGLETIVEEIKEVKDLLKSTNADVKAYKKDLASKVAALVDAADDYLTDNGNNADTTAGYEVALDKALNAFREADATALKNFVEDYIGSFFTLTPKKLNSGNYVVRLENADYGRYVEAEDVFNALERDSDEKGLQYLLTTVIDTKTSADTYYDELVNTVSTVEELLKAVTTDIEGLTLSSSLTDKQASKVVAARKALNQLVTDGKIATEYASALTSKEKKAVLANAELIEALYFKLIMNGTVTASGWVDKGNGEWDYIAEDGSRPTKWIASGANWYYVKNGTMLRNSWIASDSQGTRWYYVDDAGVMVSNTTINGYTFNSYGVWVK